MIWSAATAIYILIDNPLSLVNYYYYYYYYYYYSTTTTTTTNPNPNKINMHFIKFK